MTILDRALSLIRPAQPSALTTVGPSAVTVVEPQKAVTGIGAYNLTYSPPLWSLQNTPQRRSWQAAALYATHDAIRKAESSVSETGGSVEWHLEFGDEQTVDDASPPQYKAVRDLLEKPQGLIPFEDRQPGLGTFRNLLTTTLRHMGLCGTTFWYLDQTDALGGVPLGILYIAPWRLFEVTDIRSQRFLGWTLDRTLEDGGTPLERRNVLPFYLNPPDQGQFASGLVEAAAGKVPLAGIIDRHIAKVIGSGGRLAGLLSPKVGSSVTEENWNQFIRDYRGIAQSEDAALRLQIVQGPVDFVKTAADMNELEIVAIDERTDAAIRELWKVPGSQTGKAQAAGLNSGSTKGYDEAVLWQKAIHPRLRTVYETIQYELLDRYRSIGVDVELVFDEPGFDDDTPAYEIASKAQVIPLTNDERRNLIGKDPLEDADFGAAVFLPTTLAQVAGPGFAEKQAADQAAKDAAQAASLAALNAPAPNAQQPAPQPNVPEPPPAKAQLPALAKLRRTVDSVNVAAVKKAVHAVLTEQKASVVRYLRTVGLDHLRKKVDFRWNAKAADDQLEGALTAPLSAIVRKVAARTHAALATGKAVTADPFTDRVVTRVLTKGAGRVVGINQTTRDAINAAIRDALEGAETIQDVIAAVDALDIFGELRAEVIARTESMFAYNDAALGSYAELGVTEVEAIDGDEDEECAARDGQTFTVEEAAAIEDHPNGTLDWVPVIPDEPPQKATLSAALIARSEKATRTDIQYDNLGRVVSVIESPADVLQVTPVAKAAPVILFDRDEHGRITGLRQA